MVNQYQYIPKYWHYACFKNFSLILINYIISVINGNPIEITFVSHIIVL